MINPRPYQKTAIMQVVTFASRAEAPRGILVSQAGSGKALVSAWIAQRLPSRKAWLLGGRRSRRLSRAAMLEGFRFICVELDPDYMRIASARIAKAEQYKQGMLL